MKHILTRELYKEVKHYNRDMLDTFIGKVYAGGFLDGQEEMMNRLEHTPGIGEKTMKKIRKAMK